MSEGKEGGYQPDRNEIKDAEEHMSEREKELSEGRAAIDKRIEYITEDFSGTLLARDLQNWQFLYKTGLGEKLFPEVHIWDPEGIQGRLDRQRARGEHVPSLGFGDAGGSPENRVLINGIMSDYVYIIWDAAKHKDERGKLANMLITDESTEEVQQKIEDYFSEKDEPGQ